MRPPLTFDSVIDRAAQVSGEAGHRKLAANLLGWAAEPIEGDEVPVAYLLLEAGEQLDLAGDAEAALEAYRASAARPETTVPDARAFVVHTLVGLGRVEEAEELSEQLRRSRPADAQTYELVGETWEAAGELDRANRWFTRGLMLAEEQQERGTFAVLLISRRRVRRAIGFPPDGYDEAAEDLMMEALAERLGERDGGGRGGAGRRPR